MATIKGIKAREILDSRGNPTVEADVITDLGTFRAAVPSGASTGIYEALELRDKDPKRYGGKGVLKAVENVNLHIKPALIGKDVTNQKEIDMLMVEKLDATKNEWGFCKAKLGANAILAVSLAVARAGAAFKKVPLYEYIASLAGKKVSKYVMPVPSFNIINGGAHAGNKLHFQEFMIMPTGAKSFKEAMQIGIEVYQALQKILKDKFGPGAINVGDEGGFGAPELSGEEEALECVMKAIETAGHKGKVKIATDIAASDFFVDAEKKYNMGKKTGATDKKLDGAQLQEYIEKLCTKFPFVSIEDPFDQDDFDSYAKMNAKMTKTYQIVGDDLLVTNPKRIQMAIDKKLCNALLLKVNQIGSLTEAIEACLLAQKVGWGVMVSHRSGETEDCFIADLVVGLGTGQIKTGAPCRSDRLAKYNQLVRIEEELGAKSWYAGAQFRLPDTSSSFVPNPEKVGAAKGKPNIWLVRHGFSLGNYWSKNYGPRAHEYGKGPPVDEDPDYVYLREVKDKLDPRSADPQLHKKGIMEAEKCQEKINKLNVKMVFISPLRRTLQTCRALFGSYPKNSQVVYKVNPILRELMGSPCSVPYDTLTTRKKEYAPLGYDFGMCEKFEKKDLFFLYSLNSPEREEIFEAIEANKDKHYCQVIADVIRKKKQILKKGNRKIESYVNVRERAVEFAEFLCNYIPTSGLGEGDDIVVVAHSLFISYCTASYWTPDGSISVRGIPHCQPIFFDYNWILKLKEDFSSKHIIVMAMLKLIPRSKNSSKDVNQAKAKKVDKCSKGHRLFFASKLTGSYACKNCKKAEETKKGGWYCIHCMEYVCKGCVSLTPPDDAKMDKMCGYGHLLKVKDYPYPWSFFRCKKCFNEEPSANKRWNCSFCTYDVCLKCKAAA